MCSTLFLNGFIFYFICHFFFFFFDFLIKNHDCQPYNSEMEAMQPVGDALFASIFSDRFTPEYTANIPGVSIIYNNETVYNPAEDTPSWFQNYQLTINETLVIFCLDWNTRLVKWCFLF